jgi:glucose uptake protein GlcU
MECENGVLKTDLGEIPCTPTGFASSLYGIGLSFIGVVALLFIVYGGFLVLTSQGNQDQLRRGKAYITYSIVGVVLAIAGYALYQILAIDVVKVPGFSR